MATIIVIGNLTKDAELRTTNDGRKYVLLQVAENIRKRDEQGNFVKDAEGHYINAETFFHSVFVNKGDAAFQVQDLKKGHTVKVIGRGKLRTEKDSNNYDQYVLDRIVATYVDTDPFKDVSEAAEMATDADLEDIPFDPPAVA